MVATVKNSAKSSLPAEMTLEPKNASTGKTSWQTRFKQGACLALLSSPLAAAARPGLPTANTGRQLLQTACSFKGVEGPYSAALPLPLNLPTTSLAVLPASPNAWAQYQCESGVPTANFLNGSSIPLTYTFGPVLTSDASGTLDTAAENFAIMDMVHVAQTVGVQSNRVDFNGGEQPNIMFIYSSAKGHNPWETAGLTSNQDSQVQSHAYIYAYQTDITDWSWKLGTIAQALGLKKRGEVSYAGANPDIGLFPADFVSSVTFPTASPCANANVTRMGALDLRALANFYGYATGMDANAVITIDDNFGVGGFLASDDTNNTLVIKSSSDHAVQVYMADDGGSDTFVGNSMARLAPGSRLNKADISATHGGMVMGNQYPNQMIGSAFNDTFIVGADTADITLNGGWDLVFVPVNGSAAYIHDMNKQSTIYMGGYATPKISSWGGVGSSVVVPGGASAYVYNLGPNDVRPLLNYLSDDDSLPAAPSQTAIALCTAGLMKLNFTNSPGSTPIFNPCEHIGESGDGAGSCG